MAGTAIMVIGIVLLNMEFDLPLYFKAALAIIFGFILMTEVFRGYKQ